MQAPAKCKAVFELEIHAFFNHQHILANGLCCEAACTTCFSKFDFCLQPYNYNPRNDMDCPWGKHSTEVIATDNIVFRRGHRLDKNTTNPLEFVIRNWNVSA